MGKKNKATPKGSGMLRGWKQISEYCGVPARTLYTWRAVYGFPVANIGRTVTTTPKLIDDWMLERCVYDRQKQEDDES